MDYEIIFYHSGKTAETERLLEKKFAPIELARRATSAAVSPSELANRLKDSLTAADIVVIIGGLDGGRQSTDAILSLILSSKASSLKCEKLLDDDDNLSYLIRAGEQCIIVFPDEPEIIETMLDKRLMRELCRIYSLSAPEDEEASIDEVTGELKKQLSGMKLVRSGYGAKYAEKQLRELKIFRIAMWSALAAGILLLIIAIILFSI